MRLIATLAAGLLLLGSCTDADESAAPDDATPEATAEATPTATPDPLRLDSPVLVHGEPIPEEFACDGEDVSPPLSWDGVPMEAVELSLLVNDRDAPGDGFVHWVLYGLDPRQTSLETGALPPSAVEGANGRGEPGWRGPCPPPDDDPHTYVFTLWALDADTMLEPGATADELRAAAEGHIVAEGTLEVTYDR